MKKLLLLLLLTSCTNSLSEEPKVWTASKQSSTDLVKRVDALEEQVDYMNYEQINKYCFNFKDICNLQAYNFCNKKAACVQKAEKQCFAKHEQCIILNYRHWQEIKKAKGYK
jgi:hypothetical protein